MRPNILLVVLDSARADAFEPYGATPGASPVIADLARSGEALPAAYAAASWTVPSHAAMLTGVLPRALGLTQAPGRTPQSCRPRLEQVKDQFLPEVLRRNGYRTGAATANVWLGPDTGFEIGFDHFEAVIPERHAEIATSSRRSRLRWFRDALLGRGDDGAGEALQAFREFLSARDGRPFFWFVNLIEAHSPYMPPKPHNDLGPRARVQAMHEARRYLSLERIWKANAGDFDIPGPALERMRTLYAGAVHALDTWVGKTLELLDQVGGLDETLVVVTSDHGENFGEGGRLGHAFSLDERLIRIPCVVAGPGAFAPQAATSLTTLPRLIAEGVGINSHPWRNSQPADVAVAQFDPPADDPDDPRIEKAVEYWGLGRDAAERITTRLTCATDGHRKVLIRGDAEELYEFASDPLEVSPIELPGIVEPEVTRLRELARGAHEQKARHAAEGDESRDPTGEDLALLEERMRLLGYL